MPILDPVRFDGELANTETTIPVAFAAGIDDDGGLALTIDPIVPGRLGAAFVPEGVPLQPRPGLRLTGRGPDGWEFASDDFHVARWSRPPNHCEIAGDCGLAELSRPVRADHADMRAWFVRKLKTFHGLERRTPLGRLVFTGYSDAVGQRPSAVLAIHAGGCERDGWWDESERFLIHLSRVLSFACDVYVLPLYEQRVRHDRMTLRTVRQAPAPNPYMPPFDALYMAPIFDCAVGSFETHADAVERLDPAIRWLTAAVAYEESRLVNAMSALESILARSDVPTLMINDPAAFAALKKKVQLFLKAERAPGRMGGKVGELNRWSIRDRLELLLRKHAISTEGFPPNWLPAIIETRNVLIHTGVSPELHAPDARLLDHIVWAREIAQRIILDAIGFAGPVQSWLNRGDYVRFPECRPMSEIAAADDEG